MLSAGGPTMTVGPVPSACSTTCNRRPNSAMVAGRFDGSFCIASSSTSHSDAGTPRPRRSGTGSRAIRRNSATRASSSRGANGGSPASS